HSYRAARCEPAGRPFVNPERLSMTSKFSRWLTSARRYFDGPNPARRRRTNGLSRLLLLENRVAPAVFTGGASVASGDIDGDGVKDTIVGAGPGGAPLGKVVSGKTGAQIPPFHALDAGFTGGVSVGAGAVVTDGPAGS